MIAEGWAGQALGTPRLVLALPQAMARQMLWGHCPHGSSARAPSSRWAGIHGQGWGWAPGWGGHGVAGGSARA